MNPTTRRDLLLLAALAFLCYLPGIGSRDLWNPDEPRYGQVAREMLEGGTIQSFVVPHLNGGLYTHKPPLLFWSIAAFSAPFGDVSEVTTRIPSLLAAVAAILGVYRLGLLLFGRRTALWAALILGSCYKINWQGHVGQIDMLLAALVLWSVYFWARGYLEKKPGCYWLYFVFAGLATLAKGPVGLLPTLIAILVFLALQDRPALRDFPLWRGLALWAGVVLLWLGPALHWGGELYQREILFKQNVTRYVDPWHHYQPPHYFLKVLPIDFLPWSLLLPAALLAGWRLLRGEERRRWLFLVAWVLTTLVFFSVSPAKRTVYILPLYPAVALLAALGLDLLAGRTAEIKPRMSRWWLRAPALFLTGVVALAALAVLVAGPGRKEVAMVGHDLPYLLGGSLAALAAGLAWATRELWRFRIDRFVIWKAASFALFLAFAWAAMVPRLDPVKSTRALCGKLATLAGPNEPYATFPNFDATFLFYCRRFAAADLDESEKKLNEFVNRPERVFLAVERDDWKRIENKPDLIEVHRDPDEMGGYLLFKNKRPAPAGAPP